MQLEPADKTIEAKHGDKTIRVTIGFDARLQKGPITPKHAWERGWVWIRRNNAHGFKSYVEKQISFNSLQELPAAIQKVLDELE
jgi:hypothetical protein